MHDCIYSKTIDMKNVVGIKVTFLSSTYNHNIFPKSSPKQHQYWGLENLTFFISINQNQNQDP